MLLVSKSREDIGRRPQLVDANVSCIQAGEHAQAAQRQRGQAGEQRLIRSCPTRPLPMVIRQHTGTRGQGQAAECSHQLHSDLLLLLLNAHPGVVLIETLQTPQSAIPIPQTARSPRGPDRAQAGEVAVLGGSVSPFANVALSRAAPAATTAKRRQSQTREPPSALLCLALHPAAAALSALVLRRRLNIASPRQGPRAGTTLAAHLSASPHPSP